MSGESAPGFGEGGARMEGTLSEREARFHAIFNTLGEAILLHDGDTGRIVDANQAALLMYGYDWAALRECSMVDLSAGMPPYGRQEAEDKIVQARAGALPSFEWRARRRNGDLFWVEVTLRATDIAGHRFVLAAAQDITARKRYQDEVEAKLHDLVALNKKLEDAHIQLLQSEKMASIGQLAAGVAHEINNPVGYVISNIGSLERYLQDFITMLDAYERAEPAMEPRAREMVRHLRETLDINYLKQDVISLLAESREGINRVRRIVQDLKDFSRVGAEDEWQWSDIQKGLESTLNIVWNELKYKATVEKDYGQLPLVYCLPSQLNQVFMNLLMNAAHAIEAKGVVTVRTGQEGSMVWVEVADTGAGISAENLKRIFDPFFTTKPVGQGTGLGLAVSYRIVDKHQGRIEVVSEVGKGSVFRVWLPIEPVVEKNSA